MYHIRHLIITYHVSFLLYDCIMYQSSFVSYNISYDRSWNDIMPILTVFHFGRWHHQIIPLYTILYQYQTVGGRNPASLGSFSYYLQCSTHPRWLFGISSIKSRIWKYEADIQTALNLGRSPYLKLPEFFKLRRFASAQLEACSLFRAFRPANHSLKKTRCRRKWQVKVWRDTNLRLFKYDIYLTQPMVNL